MKNFSKTNAADVNRMEMHDIPGFARIMAAEQVLFRQIMAE